MDGYNHSSALKSLYPYHYCGCDFELYSGSSSPKVGEDDPENGRCCSKTN